MTLDYNADFAESQQCKDYIAFKPTLFPLGGLQRPTMKAISLQRKSAIDGYTIGQTLHLNLRIYDGEKDSWFEALNLPDKEKDYVTEVTLVRFLSPSKVRCNTPAFRCTITLNAFDLFAYTTSVADFSADRMVLITADSERQFPKIFQL